MSQLSIVLPAEATRHSPLAPLPVLSSERSPSSCSQYQHDVLGGWLGGSEQLVWRALGPTVEVLESSGTRVAAWTFGSVLRSTTAKVLCVCGIGGCTGSLTHVAVGVDRGAECTPRGLLGVLALATSKIVRAFTFPQPVVCVSAVRGGDSWVDECTLHPALRLCTPLLVLATDLPAVHLLDLALDITASSALSDEVSPAGLLSLPPLPSHTGAPPLSLHHHRQAASRNRLHLAANLLEGSICGPCFALQGPGGAVLCQLSVETVRVATLLYVPQLAALAIGYSFGSFQLYNMHTMSIDCASPYEEGVPGVSAFAYQEPENDPRNCVYLWLCRSADPSEEQGPSAEAALCTLYSLTYEKREWMEGHGLWYQGLTAIIPRFEFKLEGSPCPLSRRSVGAQTTVLFTTRTVTRPTTPPPLAHCPPELLLGGAEEESGNNSVSDLSLCLFGWYSTGRDERGRPVTQHHVALFDINQWYQAQMPASALLRPGVLCPYLSFHRLDRVPCGAHERVLAAAPLHTSAITRHVTSPRGTDRDWYPASLAYGVGVLSSSGCAWYACRSAQQACVRWLLAQGPACVIMCPRDAALRCVFAGLTSEEDGVDQSDEVVARDTVLDVCLTQHLLSLLSDCVSEFSDGKFASLGCTLAALLRWACGRVTTTNADNDVLLSVVLSHGGPVVTPDEVQRLHHHHTILGSLRSVLALCAQHVSDTTRHAGGDCSEVTACARLVTLLHQHLTVTLWFLHCQLLPEVDPSMALDDSTAVPFPASSLMQIYHNRRREICSLNCNLDGSELLLIDDLVGELHVEDVDGWGDEGEQPRYPPPSLRALLNLYLLPDPPLHLKHRIVQYLFLDVSSILADGFSTAVEFLIKFPASAKLSPSIIKLTQAFWLLDQQDFQSAVDLFLDPLVVRSDITSSQHRRILRALLCQHQPGLALSYLSGRAPPQLELQDTQLHLSVLLANGRVREAFHYQRLHATAASEAGLLQHLLQGCEVYGRLSDMLQLPLLSHEEALLVQHLQTSQDPHAHHVLTVLALREHRYSSLLQSAPVGGPAQLEARSALLRCYAAHRTSSSPPSRQPMPPTRHLVSLCPLSARLRHAALSPARRAGDTAHRLRAVADPPASPTTPFRSHAERHAALKPSHANSLYTVLFPSREQEPSTSHKLLTNTSSFMSHATLTADAKSSLLGEVSTHITALLSTPPAARLRRHHSLANAATVDTVATTPQSILKVRSLLQRPQSPCSTVGELMAPAPPSAHTTPRYDGHDSAPDDECVPTGSAFLTPKQLRFSLPTPPPQEQSCDGPASTSSPAPLDRSDSDDHSDLDVQLDPYIQRNKTEAASTILYEEQESWELITEDDLLKHKTDSEAVTSFTGLIRQVAEHGGDRADDSMAASPHTEERQADTPPPELDSCSDINDQYFSFDSEDQDECGAQNPDTVAEKHEQDVTGLPRIGGDHDGVDGLSECDTTDACAVSLALKSDHLKYKLMAHDEKKDPLPLVEEQSSQDAGYVCDVLESKSQNVHLSIEEQDSQDILFTSDGRVDLNEISAEDVDACLQNSNSEVSLPCPSQTSAQVDAGLKTKIKESLPSLLLTDSEEEGAVTSQRRKRTRRAPGVADTVRKSVLLSQKEKLPLLHLSDSEDEMHMLKSKRGKEEKENATATTGSVGVQFETFASIKFSSSEEEDDSETVRQHKKVCTRKNTDLYSVDDMLRDVVNVKEPEGNVDEFSNKAELQKIPISAPANYNSDCPELSSNESNKVSTASGKQAVHQSSCSDALPDVDTASTTTRQVSQTKSAIAGSTRENASSDSSVAMGFNKCVTSNDSLQQREAIICNKDKVDDTEVMTSNATVSTPAKKEKQDIVSNFADVSVLAAVDGKDDPLPILSTPSKPTPLLRENIIVQQSLIDASVCGSPARSASVATTESGISELPPLTLAAASPLRRSGRRLMGELPVTAGDVALELRSCIPSTHSFFSNEKKDADSDSEISVVSLPVTRSPARRGRRASLGGGADQPLLTTPLRRSSRRSVTPSKFGSPILSTLQEEVTPRKTPVRSDILTPSAASQSKTVDSELISVHVTPGKTKTQVDISGLVKDSTAVDKAAPVKRTTPAKVFTPSKMRVTETTSVSSPARRTRGASLLSDVMEEQQGLTHTPTKLTSARSTRTSKRLSIISDLQSINEDIELSNESTPSSSHTPIKTSAGTPVQVCAQTTAGTSVKTIANMNTDTLAKASQLVDSITPLKNVTPSRGRSTVHHPAVEDTSNVTTFGPAFDNQLLPIEPQQQCSDHSAVTDVSTQKIGNTRRRSLSTSVACTGRVGLRKSIGSMKLASQDSCGPDPPHSRRRSSRPSPVLSTVLYVPPRQHLDDSTISEDESSSLHLTADSKQLDDVFPDDRNEGTEENRARRTSLRPLRTRAASAEPELMQGRPHRRASRATIASISEWAQVGLKRPLDSMKIRASESETLGDRVKRRRHGPDDGEAL